MRYLKLTLEYDGTNFSGFQKQTGTGLRTVQDILEAALEKLTGERIRTFGAGRTDAGVHALGQVVHFATQARIPVDRFPFALNSVLPPDLIVKKSEEVDVSFHARYSALAKKYCYLILNRKHPSPLWRKRCYYFPHSLDVSFMQEGTRYLEGYHDFLAFSAAGNNVKSTKRNIFSFRIARRGDWICLMVTADGFLYKMVRLMGGTILEVGRGKFPPSRIRDILASGERGQGGPALPPQGLYLVRVYYPGEEFYLGKEAPEAQFPPPVNLF
ncbi:MAG: tRNA pseudouridine(38-40) synthase TruA [Bacillota bacterium]|nr:tRNA pseudouridine(38-40) synthase TruA [Bacillota bacterium]